MHFVERHAAFCGIATGLLPALLVIAKEALTIRKLQRELAIMKKAEEAMAAKKAEEAARGVIVPATIEELGFFGLPYRDDGKRCGLGEEWRAREESGEDASFGWDEERRSNGREWVLLCL